MGADEYLFVLVEIYHSGHKMGEECTQPIIAIPNPRWNTMLTFSQMAIRNIPRVCRIVLMASTISTHLLAVHVHRVLEYASHYSSERRSQETRASCGSKALVAPTYRSHGWHVS